MVSLALRGRYEIPALGAEAILATGLGAEARRRLARTPITLGGNLKG